MIEQDLHDVLVADGTVTALVSTRVYVGHVIDTALPAVQIRGQGGDLSTSLSGENGVENRIFQFDCYAQGEAEAANIARVVRTALTGSKTNASVSPEQSFAGIGTRAPLAFWEGELNAHRQTFEMSFWF